MCSTIHRQIQSRDTRPVASGASIGRGIPRQFNGPVLYESWWLTRVNLRDDLWINESSRRALWDRPRTQLPRIVSCGGCCSGRGRWRHGLRVVLSPLLVSPGGFRLLRLRRCLLFNLAHFLERPYEVCRIDLRDPLRFEVGSGSLVLPDADGGHRSVSARDLEVLLEIRVEEPERGDVAWVPTEP